LGRPLDPSIEIDVLDDEGAPVSPGGEGLLHVGGSPLFSGFLRHAEPAPPRFNTGDRVRVGFDGALEFLGRRDRTTNVRGFRVDLDEIERVLHGHEGVAAAAVIVDREAPGGDTLRAFISPAAVDREAILARLKSTLPGFMIPGRLHFVDAAGLPHTPSGKIDRRALATAAPGGLGNPDGE
jgi:acyl-coenzyme A synthetase/AMP-(fatty) acid ligase